LIIFASRSEIFDFGTISVFFRMFSASTTQTRESAFFNSFTFESKKISSLFNFFSFFLFSFFPFPSTTSYNLLQSSIIFYKLPPQKYLLSLSLSWPAKIGQEKHLTPPIYKKPLSFTFLALPSQIQNLFKLLLLLSPSFFTSLHQSFSLHQFLLHHLVKAGHSFWIGAALFFVDKTLRPVPSFWIGAELFFVDNITVDFPVIVRDYSGNRFGDK